MRVDRLKGYFYIKSVYRVIDRPYIVT